MTTPESAIWHPFDPTSGSASESLPAPPSAEDSGGGIVAVIASPAVVSHPWAGRAALELARSWAHGGARIMLADLGLTDPTLHHAVGVENGEGMSDVFLYGASIQRVARPVSNGTLFFAPAGTLVADARDVFSHSRWDSLEQGFGSAGALLLLYAPASQDGLDSILSRASGVVVLGSDDESVPGILDGASIPVLTALAPSEPLEDDGEVPDFRMDDPGEEPPPLVPEEGDHGEATVDGTAGAPDPAGDAPEPRADEAVPEPAEPGQATPRSGSRQTLRIFLVMLLVIAAAAAAVWYGFVELPEGFEIPFLTNSSGSSAG